MKITCETAIVYRSKPNTKSRNVNSTLAIGKNTKNDSSNVFLLLITQQNKTGTKYELKDNILKIFTKFVNEGKCTISLKIPEHDLQIKADHVQLKAFLNILKKELVGKPSDPGSSQPNQPDNNLLKAFSLSSTTLTTKNLAAKSAQLSLVIQARGDYPLKGFPRTLKNLSINGINRCSMDRQILHLTNLTSLNLSDNSIEKLPKELGNLKLRSLDISKNQFGISTKLSDWDWMKGQNIGQSLVSLILTNNDLKFIAPQICFCENLEKLMLDSNKITKIPFLLKVLKRLRFLNLSQNQIQSLPSSFLDISLDTLDISNNAGEINITDVKENHIKLSRTLYEHKPATLLELAAQSIVRHKIPYTRKNIPPILKEVLIKSPTCLQCRKISMSTQILEKIFAMDSSNLRAKAIVTSSTGYILMDGTFCSKRCIQRLQRRFFGEILLQ